MLIYGVAPLVGAWIEIVAGKTNVILVLVAPLVGAWIEIPCVNNGYYRRRVAPLVGAWIEIAVHECGHIPLLSLPSWERGLK